MPKVGKAPRDWYGEIGWKRRRRDQLRREPLCCMCLAKGLVAAAVVADHIQPVRGDRNRFVLGALQSLCARCHNADKRYIEHHGHPRPVYGLDGWPVDR